MIVKRRTELVIFLSSFIIAAVLSLTLFGFYAYLGWKENNMRRNYNLSLYEVDGELFSSYIKMDLQAKIGKEGAFRKKPIVLGTIKNDSNKTIYSLKLKVAFRNPEKEVIYVDVFHPIGTEFDSFVNLSELTRTTENFLREGDSISFKHQLKNCPPEVLNYLKAKLKFARSQAKDPLELIYKVEGLNIR